MAMMLAGSRITQQVLGNSFAITMLNDVDEEEVLALPKPLEDTRPYSCKQIQTGV